MLDGQALFQFAHGEDVEGESLGQVVPDEDAGDLIVKELLIQGEEGAGGVGVSEDGPHRVPPQVVHAVVLQVVLIGIELLATVVLASLLDLPHDLLHPSPRLIDPAQVGEHQTHLVRQHVSILQSNLDLFLFLSLPSLLGKL